MASADSVFGALSDPTRRTILEALRDGPRSVGEIAERLPVTRAAVSQHLRVLKDAPLVDGHSKGTRRIYAVDRKGFGALHLWLDRFGDPRPAGSATRMHEAEGREKSMSETIVYGLPGSPFLRTVEIVLKEKEVPYRMHALAPGEHLREEHLKRHPFGRVPVLELDGFTLYETQAIMRYVDECFPHPPLTPGTPRQRARMNQVIGIIEWYFFPKASAPIGFNRIIGPRLLGLPADETVIAEAMPMARTCVAEFERLLGDQAYFTGSGVSLADIMLAAQLDLLRDCAEGRELIEGAPKLGPWLDRMLARPSFAATQPPEVLREAA